MRLRSRLLCVLAIVGLWFVVPARLAPEVRADVGHELVEQWLLGADSPLPMLVHDGRMPTLQVDLRTSPPTTDREILDRRAAHLGEIGRTWRIQAGIASATAGAQAWPLLVRIGEHGVQAEVPRPDGSMVQFVGALPTRWCLLSTFAVAVLAVLGVPFPVWLLASVLATLGMLWALALPGAAGQVWPGLMQQVWTLDVLVPAVLAVAWSRDWRPTAPRERPDATRMLLAWACLALVVAGQRHLEVGMFCSHQGMASWLPMAVIAVGCVLTAKFGALRLAYAAALLLVTPLLSHHLLFLLWMLGGAFSWWRKKPLVPAPAP